MLIWCIFLVILPLVIVLLYFTHVILEEAKSLLGLTGVGTTVVSLIVPGLLGSGQISCVTYSNLRFCYPKKVTLTEEQLC